jgi:predicted lipoprotein with Yx(FWY)xxD motif
VKNHKRIGDVDVRNLRSGWLAGVVLMVGVIGVACGGGSASSTASSPEPTATAAAAATVATASKTVAGKSQEILVDAKGLTLYYFTPDKGGAVTCTGACAQAWPPLMLPSGTSTPVAGKGVTGKLSAVSSPQGGMQVTYNGWPLYYYVKDKDAEDTYGQGVGGKWFVVTPDVASAT